MKRRRRFVLLLVLLLLGLILALPPVAQRVLRSRLQDFFHRDVNVGSVSFRILPFDIVVESLTVGGLTPGSPPFLELRRAELAPSVTALLGPRVSFSHVHLRGLKIRINAFPEPRGGDDIPKMGGGPGGRSVEVRVRRLSIEDSEVIIDHARVPLDLELPEFHGRLAARRAGVLAGKLSFERGSLRFGDAPPLAIATDLEVALEGLRLTVESAHVRTEKTDLAYQGQIQIQKDPQGELTLSGPVDLAELDRHVMRTGFGIQGDAHFDGRMSIDGPRIRIKGEMVGTAGVYDGVPVPHYAARVAKDERGVHIAGLDAEFLGGKGRFDIEVPPGRGVARLDAHVDGIDAEPALMTIFDIGAAGVAAAASGDVSIRWPRGQIRRLSGRIGLDFTPREAAGTPLTGRFDWSAHDGVQQVERADLRTPQTWARLKGAIQVDDRTDLNIDGESADLAATDDLLLRLRRALGSRDARAAGFAGSGSFRGRWTGTLREPVFEGRFSGQDVGYRSVVWGRAEWAGRATTDAVECRSLVLRREGGELWLDGRSELGDYGEQDGMDLRVRYVAWPAQDFVKALDWHLELSGLLSGEATLTGRRSAPFGSIHIRSPSGRYYGVPYADLDVASRQQGSWTEFSAGRAQVGGGGVRFRGTLSDDGVYDGTAELEDVELGAVAAGPLPKAGWGGRVSGDLALRGPLERPWLRARLRSPRLFLGDEGVGAVSASLEGRGDGRLALQMQCRSPRVELALGGELGAVPPYAANLHLAAQATSLDPYLRLLLPSLSPAVGVVASGSLELRGPLLRPKELELEAAATSLEVLVPDYPVRNQSPVRLRASGGRLTLEDVHLAGEGTDLLVSGGTDLAQQGPVALSVRGEADLRTLSVVTRRLRGQGAAHLKMAVAGSWDAPSVDGTLVLEGAGLRVRGFPHGVEDVRGTVRFSETAAHFEGLTATLGGGALDAEGQAAYQEGRLRSFNVHAAGHGLSLRYPEGLRSVIDADLRLFGDSLRQWVTGSVDVRQAFWTRRYDVASELLAGRRSWEGEGGSLTEGIRYDVKVRAPGTLHIDNNLATLQAGAELTLTGSYDAPAVLGHAEIDRGRVYFQGNTYVIRRGTIDFANPQKLDPLFDIEAEARIRSYRVTLKLNGTLERVYPTLSSDPPLTAVQILNLLAGADETAVATLSPAQTDQARLAATGAATLAAGKIAEEVGLERGAERLFGLNRFSIDPSVVKGGVTNPTARLTVGRRITPDLGVLYSVDLRGTEERILSVEYTLSDRLSLLLTRAEPGGFGFDLRLRQSR